MPCASLQQVLPARDTAGLRQEFIAPTFLGSFGWISLQPISSGSASNRRFFRAPRIVLPLSFPSPWNFLEQTQHQIVTTIIGQDTRRNVADDVTVRSDAFTSALKLFPRASRRRFSGPTINEGHLSHVKASTLISFRSSGNWVSSKRTIITYTLNCQLYIIRLFLKLLNY